MINVLEGKGKGYANYSQYRGMWNSAPTGTNYQGMCWGCGEIGRQQRECPKAVRLVDCGHVEAGFLFAVDVAPVSEYERTFRGAVGA